MYDMKNLAKFKQLGELAPAAFKAFVAFDEAVVWARKARSQNGHFTANLRFLTASLAAAGRTDEAVEVGRALREVEPAFRVDPFCARYPFKDASRRTALERHLKAAGLPA